MALKFFQAGNAKIEAPGVRTFTLPAVQTCPGSTPICRATCYALSPQCRYGAVAAWRLRNWQASQLSDFPDRIVADLSAPVIHRAKAFQEGRKPKSSGIADPSRYVRIHESGDFYSQVYLDKWFAICRRLPGIRFWSYTRSWHLDFSGIPSNLKIRYSLDPSTAHPAPAGLPTCIIEEPGLPGFIQCPGTASGEVKCVRDCRLCMVTDKNILFPPHGSMAGWFYKMTGRTRRRTSRKPGEEPRARYASHVDTEIPRSGRKV